MGVGQRFRGLVGQTLAGRRRATASVLAVRDTSSAGSNSFTATKGCVALIHAWSAGGSGGASSGGGGGGGGAGFKRVPLNAGQTISWVVGAGGAISSNPGGDTTVTLPSGIVLRLGGGGAGVAGGAGGTGGLPFAGWDIGRRGGSGAAANSAGESPANGGTGGAGSGSGGGGGGAAGFNDLVTGLPPGNGGVVNGVGQTVPGGGGGGTSGVSGGGMDGRVYVVVIRIVT